MIYEFEAESEKEAIERAAVELGLERDQFDVETLELQKKSLFKKGYARIRVITVDSVNHVEPEFEGRVPKSVASGVSAGMVANPMPVDEFEQKILDFVNQMIEKMGYDISAEIMFREEKKIGVKLTSSHSSILIGRKGKNLDALQLLANVYAGHLGKEDVRIILDSENYRIRREETLVRLAYVTADKVRSSRNSILLEPMNPFERRLIHTTLNDIPDIETKSEGDGLYKQIRVSYKGVR
ncbi:MAG: protein jag [Treponema sp.]|nr:protein jag [Treponema sp.]MBQ4235731.1 protein jag [Treponema sp.]